ncbi:MULTISPECIES: hypothetical protein [Prauserella salsuginis group]|uniref:Uncharacterized protein n=2 Tax=Prauserella salsuginis group TaxID=2893672 RepID=A0A839XS76_9PSEU|nr:MULTISPECIES: hypothetical protein [Prauserella salsuginis group]MBB3663473.1 hypothetical protein [Prauserella sediminis]MCR3720707.1 hypothetical protein [Prauserella flava]MCR3735212.1 hypothetical protein [Prauserella salsuginis]
MTTSTSDEQAARTGKPLLMRLGVGLFAVGMLAVIIVFVLFAAGMEDLPVWLSVAAGVVTPLGLGLGLIALVREHKGS